MMPKPKPIQVVEDDSVDVMILRRVLKDLHAPNELACAANGEEALAYLRDEDNERPCVILLDLNMPRMNGFEFLRIMRADEAMKDIPVVVVTTSGEPQDITMSYELGAVAYIVKCCDYGEFREKIKTVEPYFVDVPLPAGL
jgi:CheY-like chemotaxis protein